MERDSPNRPGTSTGRLRGRSDALMNVANRLQSPMYISDRALPPEEVTVSTIEVRACNLHVAIIGTTTSARPPPAPVSQKSFIWNSGVQGLLRLATLGSALTEEQLVASHCGEDGLVTDPDFLPGVGSL